MSLNSSSSLRGESSFFKGAKRFGLWMIQDRVISLSLFKHSFRIHYKVSNIAGHLSFIFLSVSYILSDILLLRITAIFAGFFMITFNFWHPTGLTMWLPFKWNILFIVINSVHVVWLISERSAANKLTGDEKALYDEVFEPVGLSKLEYRRFLKFGKCDWVLFKAGEFLTTEGAPSKFVMLVLRGKADVTVGGEKVYEIGPGQWIGENGLHVGLKFSEGIRTTASVRATDSTLCLVWKRGSLIDALDADESVSRAVQQSIASDLLRKLNRIGNAEEADAQHAAEALHAKQEYMYFNLLEQVLSTKKVSAHQRINLHRFRQMHHVTEEEHQDALGKLGWTLKEFDSGVKSNPK